MDIDFILLRPLLISFIKIIINNIDIILFVVFAINIIIH